LGWSRSWYFASFIRDMVSLLKIAQAAPVDVKILGIVAEIK
jgi:hypothetical protein